MAMQITFEPDSTILNHPDWITSASGESTVLMHDHVEWDRSHFRWLHVSL